MGIPKGFFGSRLQALAGLLTGRFRRTKREIVVMHCSVFSVQMSLGSVAACCKAMSEAVAATAEAIHAEVKASSAVHADETGFGRCGEISRDELVERSKPIQAEMRDRFEILLKHPSTTRKARGTAKDVLRQWGHLWTYLEHEAAVPTNNGAERAIRKAVLWRKVNLGVESEPGVRFVERMLTLAGTARKRGVDLLEWSAQAMAASLTGALAPVFRA